MDKQGYLVNDSGLRLQGYNVDANNNLVQVPADLRIVTQQSNAVPTTEVDMSLNLNASDTKEFAHTTSINPSDSTSYNFSNSTQVYDSLGVAHTVTYYQKLSDMPNVTPTGTSSTWRVAMNENDNGTLNPVPAAKPATPLPGLWHQRPAPGHHRLF